MIPTLLMMRIGRRRGIWIPLPAFLLWPFWLLGWLVWLFAWLLGANWRGGLRMGLVLMASMRDLKIDVNESEGTQVHFRLI